MPFEVPEGWCWCTVEDVFELNPKNKVEDNVICGFIPMALVDDGFGYSHSFEERPWGEVKKGYCHFQNGDIGIAKISPCFENRKSTIFSSLPNGIGAGTTELSILRGSLVDCRYFLFLFQSEWYLREGTKYFKGVVGQQRVNKEIFTTLQIPLPPLAEQQRIANAIETCMFLCSEIDEYRDGVHSAIVASKAKILDLAIHGKLVPQDDNDEPASDLLRRINPKAVSSCDNPHYENVPFEIPSCWSWCKVRDVANVARGGSPRPIKQYLTDSPDGVNWIKIGDAEEGSKYITKTAERIIPKGIKRSRYVKAGDFLLTNSMSFGKPYILATDGCIHDGWLVISPTDGAYDKNFLYYLLSSSFAYNQFSEKAGGAVVSNLNKDKVADSLFPLPPLAEQKRIADMVEELYFSLEDIASTLR